MGTLRFLLAVSIIVAHAGPVFGVSLVDARLAVQMFYLLSGFSMAYVWQGKYSASRSPLRTFFVGRALRIYPQYVMVLVPTILLSIYAWLAFDRHPVATALQHPVRGIGGLWIYLQQVVLVGMESQFFLQRAADGTLAFCRNFHQGTQPPLHYYMFVPQAWMLSLQLVFYLLVPLLVPRPRLCAAVLVLSFAARLAGWWGLRLNADPWTHRFVLFEVGVFLLGVFSHALYRRLQARRPDLLGRSQRGWGGLVALSLLALALPAMQPALGEGAYWLVLLATVPVLPAVFHATMNVRWDRRLGDLSYPIYISHLLVMWIGEFLFGIPLRGLVYFALPAALPAAVLLNRLQRAFDDYRHALVKAGPGR
jgi:peptidoglycan/LPS O-acetylase OafA/YrhL